MLKNKKILSFISVILIAFLYSFTSILDNTSVSSVNLEQIIKEVISNELNETDQQKQEIDSKDQISSLYRVVKVIDGDTVEIDMGGEIKKVRYIGIDTPELSRAGNPSECYGEEATKRNRELVEGKSVRLERDVSETDKYGRLLRYVYVDDVFINLQLVKEGYADTLTYPPDVAKADLLREAKRVAKEAQIGLWGEVCQ